MARAGNPSDRGLSHGEHRGSRKMALLRMDRVPTQVVVLEEPRRDWEEPAPNGVATRQVKSDPSGLSRRNVDALRRVSLKLHADRPILSEVDDASRRDSLLRPCILAAGIALAFSACAGDGTNGSAADLDTVGDTMQLDSVDDPRWAVKWLDDETIRFQTWRGTQDVRLENGHDQVISSRPGTSEEASEGDRVPPDAQFGSWQAWEGGRYLIGEGDTRCGSPLIISPDGRLLACVLVENDRGAETNEAHAAVIRVG